MRLFSIFNDFYFRFSWVFILGAAKRLAETSQEIYWLEIRGKADKFPVLTFAYRSPSLLNGQQDGQQRSFYNAKTFLNPLNSLQHVFSSCLCKCRNTDGFRGGGWRGRAGGWVEQTTRILQPFLYAPHIHCIFKPWLTLAKARDQSCTSHNTKLHICTHTTTRTFFFTVFVFEPTLYVIALSYSSEIKSHRVSVPLKKTHWFFDTFLSSKTQCIANIFVRRNRREIKKESKFFLF